MRLVVEYILVLIQSNTGKSPSVHVKNLKLDSCEIL